MFPLLCALLQVNWQQASGQCSCFFLLSSCKSSAIIGHAPLHPAFHTGSWCVIPVIRLAWPALYPLSHLQRPCLISKLCSHVKIPKIGRVESASEYLYPCCYCGYNKHISPFCLSLWMLLSRCHMEGGFWGWLVRAARGADLTLTAVKSGAQREGWLQGPGLQLLHIAASLLRFIFGVLQRISQEERNVLLLRGNTEQAELLRHILRCGHGKGRCMYLLTASGGAWLTPSSFQVSHLLLVSICSLF